MKTETYTLPASWACPLLNDDWTGTNDAEKKEIRDWMKSHPELDCCLYCENYTEFGRNDANRLYGATIDFVFPVKRGYKYRPVFASPTPEQTAAWIAGQPRRHY